jgi:hypothetical protein
MTEHSVPATLCEAFQATVARYPQEVALRTPGGAVTFTWREYADRVREIAAGLAGLGVGRGDTVALMMTNRPEFHLVDTAALHLGAVPFSVYNTFAPEQIRYVLSNGGSRVVVCEEQFASRLLAVTGGRVKVHDDPAATLSAYPRPIRKLAVTGLGHDQPTLLVTNRAQLPARQVIRSYARQMNIEQRLAEAIQAFHLDALASTVPLNVDLDVVLSVLAHTVCAALRRRLPGYATATPDTLQRRFLNTGGIILNHGSQIVVRLNRRTYSPVLRQASLPEAITVPWWGGRILRYEYA